MGSPETTVAVAEAVRTSEGALEELSGCLLGWKRKVRGAAYPFLPFFVRLCLVFVL